MNKDILKIAFYMAKYNIEPYRSKHVLEKLFSKELNLKSFKDIIQEIRVSLYKSNKPSLKLSQSALDAISDNNNKTITQLRREFDKMIEDYD